MRAASVGAGLVRAGPATWVGLDGEVTLFSPRLGRCVVLEGEAAREVDAEKPSDPLLRLAAAGAPLVGAHLGTRPGPQHGARLADAVTALALEPPPTVDASSWRAHHRVLGHLWQRRDGLAPDVAAEAERAYAAGVERHLRTLSDLLAWRALMDAAGIAWQVVKGPAVAARYARPDARTWNDLDLLVAPADLGAALAAATGAGWRLADVNLTLLADVVPSEVHLLAPSGTVVDLHWALTSTRVRSRGVGTTTAALFERSGAVDVGGAAVPTLGDADTLVHLCVHAAASGADRLGWMADVAAAAPSTPGGWREVAAAARDWRAPRAVAGTLVRAAAMLGPGALDVPGALSTASSLRRGTSLQQRAVGALDAALQRVVDARFPPLVTAGGRTPAWRLARSWVGLGPRPAHLALAAGGRGRRAFVDAADEPASALHASGSPADLERFLADVAGRDGAPERTRPSRWSTLRRYVLAQSEFLWRFPHAR